MISPELIRRYPFFSFMAPDQQREVAMITDEAASMEAAYLRQVERGNSERVKNALEGLLELLSG